LNLVNSHVASVIEDTVTYNRPSLPISGDGSCSFWSYRPNQALDNKQIAGAGLDVIEDENIIKDETAFILSNKINAQDMCTVIADHALMKMPNVIITPHNAYNTNEALDRILDTTTQNIASWIEQKTINVVS
jgi:D-lactate dehydrogenase